MKLTAQDRERPRFNMYESLVFAVRIQGEIGEDWCKRLGARSMSVELDGDGFPVTVLTTEPVDQAGLLGMLNHLNMLGLPLVSVECLQA